MRYRRHRGRFGRHHRGRFHRGRRGRRGFGRRRGLRQRVGFRM